FGSGSPGRMVILSESRYTQAKVLTWSGQSEKLVRPYARNFRDTDTTVSPSSGDGGASMETRTFKCGAAGAAERAGTAIGLPAANSARKARGVRSCLREMFCSFIPSFAVTFRL